MLTGIGLRNFKAFGDEMQEAPLSKITLIYGPNSGGKSSIIQALLLLKQSIRNEYADETRTLMLRGEFADLGSFQATLHKHDEGRKLGIGVRYRNLNLGDNSAENDVSMTYANGRLSRVTYKVTAHENGSRLLHATAEENYHFPFPLSAWNGQIKVLNFDGNKVVHFIRNFLPILSLPALTEVRERAQDPALSAKAEPLGKMSELKLQRYFEVMDIGIDWRQMRETETEEARARQQALSQEQARQQALSLSVEVQEQKQWLSTALELDQLMALKWEREQVQQLEYDLDVVKESQWELEEQGMWDVAETYEMYEVLPERARELEYALKRVREQAWKPGLERLEGAEELDPELRELNLSPQQILDLTPENIPADYERHLHSVNYLAPLRSAPQRLYRISSENEDSTGITGIQGEFSANELYHNEQTREDVKARFKQFKIPYELDVIKLGEASLAGEYITIALTDKRTDTQVTLADVGYGINQILPVIIEGIASQEGAILCVEQPEIHLHPRLQANIADLMIDTIADEPGKRKQWIVETHSELLITRLQRRIREGKISPDDISVLYVDPSDDNGVEGSAIIELRLGEDSYFKDHWPHGFFDDALKEELEPIYEQINSQENIDVLDEQFAE
ncbi:MAG: AAA family ATPase [Chloroflexota bacterium]|nr:AAA family ATPase [Chloroflexota bacterium]